jgi:two-component system LytT family response regulator
MESIRTLIVDDEPLARENLRIRLRDREEFTVVGECASGQEALDSVPRLRPDLVFLDIQMPGMTGFDVAERIPDDLQPVVVFVTAYDQYALEAFRVHALDYILKPIEQERFEEALSACRERVAEVRRATAAGEPLFHFAAGEASVGGEREREVHLERFVIKARGRVFFLKADRLEWVEADGDYTRLHVAGKSYLVRKTMNELEARLDPAVFVRVSRSAIVHLDRIEELEPESRGEYLIRLAGGTEVKLTRSYRERLEGRLGDRL